MECRCGTVDVLHGPEAEAYAGDHLRRDETHTAQFEERFTCPDTGRRWVLDYPERTNGDPGPARLRQR